MNINFNEDSENSVVLVDYHNNKSLDRYGVACHWWKSETTSLHCHNFYEFFIVTSGSAIHEINGRSFKLRKGTLRLIRPDDRHKLIPSPEEGCVHINISVTVQKLQAICGALDISLDELINSTEPETALSVDETQYFIRQAERISLLCFNGDEKFHVMICALLAQTVSILYKTVLFSRFDYPDWFAVILDKIHSPEYCGCSSKDVYALAGFSAPVTIEYFKKYTGKTVSEYIRSIKMSRACDFLKSTDMPIVELSNLLGYTSLSHFNRVFKEYSGITPAAYRKQRVKGRA